MDCFLVTRGDEEDAAGDAADFSDHLAGHRAVRRNGERIFGRAGIAQGQSGSCGQAGTAGGFAHGLGRQAKKFCNEGGAVKALPQFGKMGDGPVIPDCAARLVS